MAKFLVQKPFQYRQILRQPGELVEIESRDVEHFSSHGVVRPWPPKAAAKAAPAKAAEAPAPAKSETPAAESKLQDAKKDRKRK